MFHTDFMPLESCHFSSHLPVWPDACVQLNAMHNAHLGLGRGGGGSPNDVMVPGNILVSIHKQELMCCFACLVVFSGDGASCERAGVSAEVAGPRDSQPSHC